jgi:bifunctional non-homologous end joining protein LigD
MPSMDSYSDQGARSRVDRRRFILNLVAFLPGLRPMSLTSLPIPFSDPDWIFEVKFDGFRSLCYITEGNVRLVSRKGHTYKSFRNLCDGIDSDVRGNDAILDGEIVCLDERGHSQFNTLLYRRAEPCFYVFDLLWLNGKDLRGWPLIERKKELQRIISKDRASRVLYVAHIEERGEDLFKLTVERDLEGIVGKWTHGAYKEGERTSWVKIKNSHYSQIVGRDKLFEKRVGTSQPKGTRLTSTL